MVLMGYALNMFRLHKSFKLLLLGGYFLGMSHLGNAQAKLSTYLELAGSAGIYSINADYLVIELSDIRIGGRAGIGMLREGYEGSGMDIYLPISAIGLYTFKVHNIEVGIGFNMLSYSVRSVIDAEDRGFKRKTQILGNYVVGYRYQKKEGGLMLRVSYTPFYYKDEPFSRYEHWGGLSIGYTFKSNKASAASH